MNRLEIAELVEPDRFQRLANFIIFETPSQKQCRFVSFEKKKIEGTLASSVGAATGDMGDTGDGMASALGLSRDLVPARWETA